jgi:phosphoglycerate dehydrogenase-like enzyme
MFDAHAFAAMRRGALLVNVARGDIVDRAALEHALASGQLGGVGLDVFWHEPWSVDDPLFARADVMTLPHVAGATLDAYERIASVVAHNVRAVLEGTELIHRVD